MLEKRFVEETESSVLEPLTLKNLLEKPVKRLSSQLDTLLRS